MATSLFLPAIGTFLGLFALLAAILWSVTSPYTSVSLPSVDGSSSIVRDLYGDWAVVAGASEGLGAAWAEALCRHHNMNVLLLARREDVVKELAVRLSSTYGCQTDVMVQDLASSDLEERLSHKLREGRRRYGTLIYNAAYNKSGPFTSVDLSSHLLAIDVNVRGVLVATHVFAKYAAESSSEDSQRRSAIVLVSSLAGNSGSSIVANYAATKSWTYTFAKGLRMDLIGQNIDVMTCTPGPVRTPSYQMFAKDDYHETKNLKLVSKFLLQSPAEVAEECLYALRGPINTPVEVVTGRAAKIATFFTRRILPASVALQATSAETQDQWRDG